MQNQLKTFITFSTITALTACGTSSDPQLMNLRKASSAPDEFSILPTKPLEQPSDYTVLPQPNAKAVNRADRQPQSEAIAALGGNVAGGASSDSALRASTGRFGNDADIRSDLAQEDLEFRRKNRGLLLQRLFNVNVYYDSYADQSLDPYAQTNRLNQSGVRTPAAPPNPTAQ